MQVCPSSGPTGFQKGPSFHRILESIFLDAAWLVQCCNRSGSLARSARRRCCHRTGHVPCCSRCMSLYQDFTEPAGMTRWVLLRTEHSQWYTEGRPFYQPEIRATSDPFEMTCHKRTQTNRNPLGPARDATEKTERLPSLRIDLSQTNSNQPESCGTGTVDLLTGIPFICESVPSGEWG